MKTSLLLFALAAAMFAQNPILTLDNWRVRDGDDPAWSRPEFDDSSWVASGAPVLASLTDRYRGARWYRTVVVLPPELRGVEVALGFGQLNECYQVFVEGSMVGQFGAWNTTCSSPAPRSRVFVLPARVDTGPNVHIAIRRWLNGPGAAWLALSASRRPTQHAPLLGERRTIQTTEDLHTVTSQFQTVPWNLTYLLTLLAGAVSLAFYSAQRRRIEYLLFTLYCFCFATPLLAIPLFAGGSVAVRSPIAVSILALFVLPFPLAALILSRLCPHYRIVLWISAGLILIGAMGAPWTLATGSSAAVDLYFLHLRLLPVPYLVALWGLRRDPDLSTKITVVALSLFSVTDYYAAHLPSRRIAAGPFEIDLRQIGQLLFVFTMLIVLYRRFRNDQLRQSQIDEDLAAARRIQNMLLNTGPAQTPNFTVEAAYLPAREVGGDFHQEIASPDGSLLVVVGDVSGKGLPAAMLVSTVIGALGDLASRRPADVLSHLNRALAGRTPGGFVTCCCALLTSDGQAVLANAGHIPPYLGETPVELESGLPLGVVPSAEFVERSSTLDGRGLTFISDGVLEAAGAQGELFGFDRTAAIATRPAHEIAEAARAWGQNDDITVVTVRRPA